MKKLFSLIALLLLAGSPALWAQTTRQVTGRVVDDRGDAVIGATVSVPNSGTGTTTDVEGTFSLAVPEGTAEVEVRYVGFATQMVAVGEGLTITLTPESRSLQEAVVTARPSAASAAK